LVDGAFPDLSPGLSWAAVPALRPVSGCDCFIGVRHFAVCRLVKAVLADFLEDHAMIVFYDLMTRAAPPTSYTTSLDATQGRVALTRTVHDIGLHTKQLETFLSSISGGRVLRAVHGFLDRWL
jgi:hypothetical protein